MAKFVVVGGFSYAFALAQMAFYIEVLGAPPKIAYAVTLVVLLAVNFLLNRYWVFLATEEHAARQGVKYVATVAAGRGVDWAVFALLDTLAPAVPYGVAVFIAMSVVLPLKFLAFKLVVFR